MSTSIDLDPRTNAFRPDLADVALRAFVEAKKFAEAQLYQCRKGLVPLYAAPDEGSEMISQIRYGEFLDVFEKKRGGWVWVQNRNDRTVGYLQSKDVLCQTIAAMMNRINVMQTFVYAEADRRAPVIDRLYLGSYISLDGEAGEFYPLASEGYVFKKHIAPADEVTTRDYVFTAGQLLGVPYLHGGRSPQGLDAAGLVQFVLDVAGIDAPRYIDLQRQLFGFPLPCHWKDVVWKRGDIVFFHDHVGIMTDFEHMIHADPSIMGVTVEPLEEIVARGHHLVAAGRP